MARLCSSLLVLALLIGSSLASALYHRDTPQRVCGTAFLDKSAAVLKMVDRATICSRSFRPSPEWYGLEPETENDMKTFCCKIGCGNEHFIEWGCMRR